MKDFYYILGAANNASSTEIDEAYQKLARKFYPDEGEHDDFLDDRLREITEAYDVLRDSKRRRVYDTAYRRNQKKQVIAFRTRYLNIGLTIIFLVITALFADYVFRTLRGHPSKKIAVAPKPVTQPEPQPVTHPKKHHKSTALQAQKPAPATDTIAKHRPPIAVHVVAPVKPVDSLVVTIHANITGIVYLHQSPDYTSQVIAKIPDGGQVHILHKGTGWYKVGFNDQTGYVIKASIEEQ